MRASRATSCLGIGLGSALLFGLSGCEGDPGLAGPLVDENDVDRQTQALTTSEVNPALLAKRRDPARYDAAARLGRVPFTICGANDLQYVNAYDGTLGVPTSFVATHKRPVGAMTASNAAGGSKYCSGTLVGTNVFLTASHCVGASTVGHFVSMNYE